MTRENTAGPGGVRRVPGAWPGPWRSSNGGAGRGRRRGAQPPDPGNGQRAGARDGQVGPGAARRRAGGAADHAPLSWKKKRLSRYPPHAPDAPSAVHRGGSAAPAAAPCIDRRARIRSQPAPPRPRRRGCRSRHCAAARFEQFAAGQLAAGEYAAAGRRRKP